MGNLVTTAKKYIGLTEEKDAKFLSKLTGVNVKYVPWCAAFVNAILKERDIQGTNSNLARSFLKWGKDVSNEPKEGDIVVLKRGSLPWQGHVGIFMGDWDQGDYIMVLGGNQSNRVKIELYASSSVIGYRRHV